MMGTLERLGEWPGGTGLTPEGGQEGKVVHEGVDWHTDCSCERGLVEGIQQLE